MATRNPTHPYASRDSSSKETSTPQKRTSIGSDSANPFVVSNKRTLSQPSTPAKKPKISSADISVASLVKHEVFIGTLKNFTWQDLTPNIKQLVDKELKPLTVILFGRIAKAQCGIYGNLNPRWKQKRDAQCCLQWNLTCSKSFQKEFMQMTSAITTMENSVSEDFNLNGTIQQRAVKSANEFAMRWKFIKAKGHSLDSWDIPDKDGKDYWAKAKVENFEPNPLPLGVYGLNDELVSFQDYDTVLHEGADIAVTARIQTSYFNDTPYFQIVPIKIQCFQSGDEEDEVFEDVF
jgi:hypothetical protein